jgi:hypothetical protein
MGADQFITLIYLEPKLRFKFRSEFLGRLLSFVFVYT